MIANSMLSQFYFVSSGAYQGKLSNIPAKNCDPRSANIKIKRNRSIVIYINELYDFVITYRIVYIDFNFLKSLRILKTLSVLNIFKVLKVFKLDPPPVETA